MIFSMVISSSIPVIVKNKKSSTSGIIIVKTTIIDALSFGKRLNACSSCVRTAKTSTSSAQKKIDASWLCVKAVPETAQNSAVKPTASAVPITKAIPHN